MQQYQFPQGFLWGAAASGPQTEGVANKRHRSIWDSWFAEQPERFYQQVGPQTVCDTYHQYPQDVALMKQTGFNSFRTSIQWSRLIADLETGAPDPDAVRFYHAYLDEMIANGIEPMINLYHFDMPEALQKQYGGFESAHVAELFARFARTAFSLFGHKVKYWITFNEPIVPVEGGYLNDFHYPCKKDGRLAAQVAFNKLRQFSLAPYRADFPRPQAHPDWQTLELRDVTFHYPDQRFAVGPLNLTLKRGELVFLIGGNGSGKSTLAMLLTGLYQPISGQILVDGQPLAAERPEEYRKLFSAVFTDVWLFDRLLGPQGEEADPALVATWLERLQMAHKLQLENGKIADLRLSKGQKKRVALLLALAESRDIILLDEWAADQDPHFRREFYQVLLPLMQQMGKTVFAISHDDHYFQHADRLLEMRAGQLAELTGEEREQASRDAVARTA